MDVAPTGEFGDYLAYLPSLVGPLLSELRLQSERKRRDVPIGLVLESKGEQPDNVDHVGDLGVSRS